MTPVVVLDLDDTLYLERDFVRSGFAAVDRWLRETRGVAGFLDQAIGLFEGGLRGRVFDAALSGCGHAPDPVLIAELVAVYRAHDPVITLAADAVRLLQRLHGRCGLAVLTDGYLETQRAKLRALALARWCDLLVPTDQWGREGWKPSPRGFIAIEQHFGAAPAACVYVGDNPAKDFHAPDQRGWQTIRIRRPGGEHVDAPDDPRHRPQITVESLDGLDLGGAMPLRVGDAAVSGA